MDVTALPFEIERLPKRRFVVGLVTSALGYVVGMAMITGSMALLDAELVPEWLGLVLFVASR